MPFQEGTPWLLNAINQGIGQFQQARSYRDSRLDKEAQDAFQALQIAQQVGTPEDAQRALDHYNKLTGNPSTTFQPNERMFKAMGQNIPDKSIDIPGIPGMFAPIKVRGKDALSDTDARKFGLPTKLELKKEQVEGIKTDTDIANAPLTSLNARMSALKPILDDTSNRFVVGPLNAILAQPKSRGLTRQMIPQVAQRGFEELKKQADTGQWGALSAAELDSAKSWFDRAANDFYDAWYEQQTKRLSATDRARGTNINPQMINAINNQTRTVNGSIADIDKRIGALTKNPLIGIYLSDPEKFANKIPAEYTNLITQKQNLTIARDKLQSAAAGYTAGVITDQDVSILLRELMPTQDKTSTHGQAPAAAPSPVPSSAPPAPKSTGMTRTEWLAMKQAIIDHPNDPRVKGKTIEQLIGPEPNK